MKGYLNAIKWEAILDFKEYARYRIGLLMDFIVFTGTFIAIYYLGISDGFTSFYNISENQGKILVLIGYIFWQSSSAALGYITGTISSETSLGIFEVRLQSKYSMESILFCRLLISSTIHLITYIGIIAFGGIVTGYNGWDILIIFLCIILTLPALFGMYGMGLIFGSICICEKNVGSLIMIIQTLLLFITNTLSPTRNATIYFIPFSCGIEIMRNIYMKQTIQLSMILIYIIVNAIWLALGCFIFRKALKYEKTYGSLDNY